MIKELSEKALKRRKVILLAVEDYFGAKIAEDSFKRIVSAIKSGSTKDLSEEERSAAWHVSGNLKDEVYVKSLMTVEGAELAPTLF